MQTIDFTLYIRACSEMEKNIQNWKDQALAEPNIRLKSSYLKIRTALSLELNEFKRQVWMQATEEEKDRLIEIDFPD